MFKIFLDLTAESRDNGDVVPIGIHYLDFTRYSYLFSLIRLRS